MNPDEPRFGIEIKDDTLFYCEEIIAKPGTFKYYYCNYSKNEISDLQERFAKAFDSQLQFEGVADATLCELLIKDKKAIISTTFYQGQLTENQNKLIDELISLKQSNLKQIKFHNFPERLLKNKLPNPPPPPLHNSISI